MGGDVICKKYLSPLERDFENEFYVNGVFKLGEHVAAKLHMFCEDMVFVISDTDNIAFGAAIPEFDDKNLGIYTSSPVKMFKLFENYFKQSNTIFVFKNIILKKWYFYDIDDVISIICDECTWKILDSGPIRGYLKDKKGMHQYITYEPSDGSMFFGITHDKENRFNEYLKSKIAKYECTI